MPVRPEPFDKALLSNVEGLSLNGAKAGLLQGISVWSVSSG